MAPQVVGENVDSNESSENVAEQTGDGSDCEFPSGGNPACTQRDASATTEHQAWACAPNELSSLAGTEWTFVSGDWTGYGSTPLKLRFGIDGKSALEVGTPVEPVKEIGHLCSDRNSEEGKDYCEPVWNQPFPVGAVYPLHGLTKEGNSWKVNFWRESYLDQWCRLQTPRAEEASCSYSPMGNNGGLFGPICTSDAECNVTFVGPDGGLLGDACSLGNFANDGSNTYTVAEETDCGWLMRTMAHMECTCSSSYCFSTRWSGDPESSLEWTLTLEENDEVLVVTVGEEEQRFRRAE